MSGAFSGWGCVDGGGEMGVGGRLDMGSRRPELAVLGLGVGGWEGLQNAVCSGGFDGGHLVALLGFEFIQGGGEAQRFALGGFLEVVSAHDWIMLSE